MNREIGGCSNARPRGASGKGGRSGDRKRARNNEDREESYADDAGLRGNAEQKAVRVEGFLRAPPPQRVVVREVVHSDAVRRMSAKLTHGHPPEVVPVAAEADRE